MRATEPRTVAENDYGRELRSFTRRWNHEVTNASRFTSLVPRDHPGQAENGLLTLIDGGPGPVQSSRF
jgi:hypothetical protein